MVSGTVVNTYSTIPLSQVPDATQEIENVILAPSQGVSCTNSTPGGSMLSAPVGVASDLYFCDTKALDSKLFH